MYAQNFIYVVDQLTNKPVGMFIYMYNPNIFLINLMSVDKNITSVKIVIILHVLYNIWLYADQVFYETNSISIAPPLLGHK